MDPPNFAHHNRRWTTILPITIITTTIIDRQQAWIRPISPDTTTTRTILGHRPTYRSDRNTTGILWVVHTINKVVRYPTDGAARAANRQQTCVTLCLATINCTTPDHRRIHRNHPPLYRRTNRNRRRRCIPNHLQYWTHEKHLLPRLFQRAPTY